MAFRLRSYYNLRPQQCKMNLHWNLYSISVSHSPSCYSIPFLLETLHFNTLIYFIDLDCLSSLSYSLLIIVKLASCTLLTFHVYYLYFCPHFDLIQLISTLLSSYPFIIHSFSNFLVFKIIVRMSVNFIYMDDLSVLTALNTSTPWNISAT